MKPFTNFESRIVPLPVNDLDTDQIIPARFLKTISKQGLDLKLRAIAGETKDDGKSVSLSWR